VFVPQDVSVVQSIVHQIPLLQLGATPPSGAAQVAHMSPVLSHGSPTEPLVPAHMYTLVDPDWISWQVVPEYERQSAFVVQPGKQM
jgi:hypothetical protein